MLVGVILVHNAPIHLEVRVDGDYATILLDGQQHTVDWSYRPSRMFPLFNDPLVREFALDGSDTINNGTLDVAYLQRIKDTPYYRFQRWMRDEDGYDRWRNISIYDPVAGRVLLHTDTISDITHIRLPSTYIFSADLHRLELYPRLVWVNEAGVGYHLIIARNAHAVELHEWAGGTGRSLARWFFPRDPWPHLARLVDTLVHVGGWAIIALAIVAEINRLLPHRAIAPPTFVGRVIRASLLLGTLLATAVIARDFYGGQPHIFDATSIVLQAKIFASGRLNVPAPFDRFLFDMPFMAERAGRYFSQYPPGAPLLLAPGFIMGWPWLTGPLVTAGTLAGIYLLGRRLYDRPTATLALLLAASSPFVLFMAGSYMVHPVSLFFLTFFVLFLVQGRAALAAIFLGLAFLTRESVTVFVAAPWLAAAAGVAVRKRRWLAIGTFILVIGLFALAFLWYNAIQTGQPFLVPRLYLDPNDRYGFGQVGFYGEHTIAAGLVNTDQNLTILLIHLFGWPFYLTLVPLVVPFITARANRWDTLLALGILSVMAGFAGYFYHGIVYGPRYYYEALPFLVLLTARGFRVMARPRWAGPLALLAVLMACNVFYYLPRQVELYRDFAGGSKRPNLAAIYGLRLNQAVVATRDLFVYRDILASLNCVDFDRCPTVYVRAETSDDLARLKRHYPTYSIYELTIAQGREPVVTLRVP